MKIKVQLELDVPLHAALEAEADADDSPVGYHIECVLAERQECRRGPGDEAAPVRYILTEYKQQGEPLHPAWESTAPDGTSCGEGSREDALTAVGVHACMALGFAVVTEAVAEGRPSLNGTYYDVFVRAATLEEELGI